MSRANTTKHLDRLEQLTAILKSEEAKDVTKARETLEAQANSLLKKGNEFI